jgi:hypothetical protein
MGRDLGERGALLPRSMLRTSFADPRSMLRTSFAERVDWFDLNGPRWSCRLEPV